MFRKYQRSASIGVLRLCVRCDLQIYPSFCVLLLFAYVRVRHDRDALRGRRFVPEVLFFQNYVPGVFAHTWSLAVEEHFYLVIPLLLLALASRRQEDVRDPFTPLPWIFLPVAVIELVARHIDQGDYRTHILPT